MPCSRLQALASLFSNLCTTLKFLLIFFYLFSLSFAKLFTFFFRGDDEYDDCLLFEEDGEEEEEEIVEEDMEHEYRYSHDVERDDHLVADIVTNGEALASTTMSKDRNSYESIFEDTVENIDDEDATFYVEDCTTNSDFNDHDHCRSDDVTDYEVIKTKYTTRSESNPTQDNDIINEQDQLIHNFNCQSHLWQGAESINEDIAQTSIDLENYCPAEDVFVGESEEKEIQVVKEEINFCREEKFLIFDPPKSEARKLQALEKEKEDETAFEDTFTTGSTSKSSSEWRSSIRDSGTELDPFSSSSRRSCPKWESYAVYQKYEEEMMFLHRISAQKLHETESLKSIMVEPRSISQRIVHKLCTKRRSSNRNYKKSYNELEAAYVAQICVAWEALNWNYANFQRKQVSRKERDLGCPAHIAQQFQQFQVLLQRYIETEPYERGRRPEIYARMRTLAPKLLQVPEYHDYEGEDEKEGEDTRIASSSFQLILEEAIRAFRDFLKADRTQCQALTNLFKRPRRRQLVDVALVHMVQKHNQKMKSKLKEVQRSCVCLKKKRLTREEEMEMLMSHIDLKVVSRVLRMANITRDQLQWCEDKMCKLQLSDGKLHRDSSPLFFPAH